MIVSQTKIDPPPFEGESAAKLQKSAHGDSPPVHKKGHKED